VEAEEEEVEEVSGWCVVGQAAIGIDEEDAANRRQNHRGDGSAKGEVCVGEWHSAGRPLGLRHQMVCVWQCRWW